MDLITEHAQSFQQRTQHKLIKLTRFARTQAIAPRGEGGWARPMYGGYKIQDS